MWPVAEMPGGESFTWVAVRTGEGTWCCHPSSILTAASGGDMPPLCSTGSSVTVSHSRLVSMITTSLTWIFRQISPSLLCIRGSTAGQKWPQALPHQSFSFFPFFCKRASVKKSWEGAGNVCAAWACREIILDLCNWVWSCTELIKVSSRLSCGQTSVH